MEEQTMDKLIKAVNAVTFRLYVLEKILSKLHTQKKLDKIVSNLEKEIENEFQTEPSAEVQDKKEGGEELSNGGERPDDSAGSLDAKNDGSSK